MKTRQYSCVIHNVAENCQAKAEEYAKKNTTEYVLSVEPYPQGGGFHLHLFLQYPNQRHFKAVLKDLEKFKKSIITTKPAGEERDWGRVQVDVMRGRFSQADDYLAGLTKDKPTGEVLKGERKPCFRRHRYINQKSKTIEECCGICWSNLCQGCCKGCEVCDENHPRRFGPESLLRYEADLQTLRKKYLNSQAA